MTDSEFLQQAKTRLLQLQGEQKQLHTKFAESFHRMNETRVRLVGLSGVLAAGLGLSIGYLITRR